MNQAIAIFDIGKTNKKLLLFDRRYKIVYERTVVLPEINDEDGFPAEDINALTQWVHDSLLTAMADPAYDVCAVNFSAYGASLVHLDELGIIVSPLYNYMNPCPDTIKQRFYDRYGGERDFARITASPVLGNLNSGMQLFRLKCEKPLIFSRISISLHLPQYLGSVISGKIFSEITSIGCHTNLWDFTRNAYHQWIYTEGIDKILAPLHPAGQIASVDREGYPRLSGVGLHDSSAALIPYLYAFREPFLLISTGTWCISLNPFNESPLTEQELLEDCLCYLSYTGRPIKASRLFAGHFHEQQVKRLATHYNTPGVFYKAVTYSPKCIDLLKQAGSESMPMGNMRAFADRDLTAFASVEAAYHQLVTDIVMAQVVSTQRVLKSNGTHVKRIFVDGGFSKNLIYMNLLAMSFPGIEVYAAMVPQASALGAALVLHETWNPEPIPRDLIALKLFSNL